MNLNSVMRFTYLLAWASAIIAILYRGLQILGMKWIERVPVTSRGVLFFSAFLFLATLATAAYTQAQASSGMKGRGASV